jgi:sulfatase modifying factor 1
MQHGGSLARPRRLRSLGGFVLVAAGCLASGCLVSFDGYRARTDGGAAGAGATETMGAKSSGAASADGGRPSSAGADSGGMAGEGASEPGGAGEAGSPDGGGSAGNGGSAGAGNGGVAGASGNAGSGGGGGQTPKACPVNLEGPPMIEIPKPDGGFYCMDRSEVPSEDYAVFLASNPSSSGQASACAWNTTFQPDVTNACTSQAGAYDPQLRPRSPVSCVDWCDAKRYCEWAGKHLCGAIGGGTNPPSQFADASQSEWYRACSKGGTRKYPYGDSYEPASCVGLDNSGVHPNAVANAIACEGGEDGLFDMSGNVAEWEDSCNGNAGANDSCLIRGGNLLQAERTTPSLLCNSSKPDAATPSPAMEKRNLRHELIGFRCCFSY